MNPNDKLPPHSVEAEAGIIACMMMSPEECVDDAREAVPDANAFYDLRYRAVFDTLVLMAAAQEPIDPITLQVKLKERGLLDEVGGMAFVAGLPDAAPAPGHLPYYVGVVREKFMLRRWLQLCGEIANRVQAGEEKAEELADDISQRLFRLCEAGQSTSEKTMAQVRADVHEQVLDKFQRGVKFRIGPQTGFNYLDNIVPGLGPGQLAVMAARPRTGKTAIMMQMAEHIGGSEKVPVAVFSLEMTATSLGTRAIFQRAGADLTKFLNGFMADEDIQKLTAAGDDLAPLPIYIDESPRMALEDLEIRARRLVRRRKVGVIFIDYFQLLYVRNRHRQWSKADELAECSMRLKGLAKELKVPIVLCAQMNREIERETHRRPRLSDLRDTGQLEQDADVIMFLWKPDVTSDRWKNEKIPDIMTRVPVNANWKICAAGSTKWKKNLAIVCCTVEKQREGRSGEDALLVFIKPWTRFVDAYRPPREGEQRFETAGPTGEEEPE